MAGTETLLGRGIQNRPYLSGEVSSEIQQKLLLDIPK
jgi:hypothetical protein